jgi:hypothetical protein
VFPPAHTAWLIGTDREDAPELAAELLDKPRSESLRLRCTCAATRVCAAVGLTDRLNCSPRVAHSPDLSRGENRPDSWGEPARLGVIPWGEPAKLLVKNYYSSNSLVG